MTATPRFHELRIARVQADSTQSIAVTFEVPDALRQAYAFTPGQYLSLRATVQGVDLRRTYSICSTPKRLQHSGEIEVGIRAIEGGQFSNWAVQNLKSGQSLQVMTPDGRFQVQRPRAIHRVGFAAGSGITPILSILATTLEEQPESKFTLVYGNRRMASVMFNEALQDLKDRYPARLTLIHILSRQAQEVPLLEGRIDASKVREIMAAFLPAKSMDEVFICGPMDMIDATQAALIEAQVPAEHIQTERFVTAATPPRQVARPETSQGAHDQIELGIVLDGKQHEMRAQRGTPLLDAALEAGLDLPFSCKGGVCCTCRAKVMTGTVSMDKNFGLSEEETAKGFVLSCQARATSSRVVLNFDER